MKAIKYISALILGAVLAGCSGDPVLPPLPEGPNFGLGTQESPFTAAQVTGMNNPGTSAWVKGYIVGTYNFDLGSAVQTEAANWVNSNILIAADPTETVFANCVAVQLAAGPVRDALNLPANPQNLGQEVAVYGSLEKYCGTAGVKSTAAAIIDGQTFGKVPEPTPDTPVEGDGNGTAEKPYSVDQLIALGNPGTVGWAEGIIVGTYKYDLGSGVQTDPANFDATNVLLAQNAGETEWSKCIAIQLPAGDLRNAINLVNNPDNLGKKLAIQGTLTKYCGLPGVKEGKAAVLDGTAIGAATPDTPSAPAEDAVDFVKVTTLTSGMKVAFWADNKVGKAMDCSKGYSYLYVDDATPEANGDIKAVPGCTFTLTETAQGWTIQTPDGYYWYLKVGSSGTPYTSANLDTTLGTDASFYWDITIESDGTATVKNKQYGSVMQYSTQYTSFGFYTDLTKGNKPTLYQVK